MKIDLSDNVIEWQQRAREYADEYLQPHEVEAELNAGVLAAYFATRQLQNLSN